MLLDVLSANLVKELIKEGRVMKKINIDWGKPWESYSKYLPEKTSDQLLMFLIEEGISLYHDTSYNVGVIPDYDGYRLNVKAPTLVDALRGAMIKLYFSRENNDIYYGSACLSEEKLKEYQQKLLDKLKGF